MRAYIVTNFVCGGLAVVISTLCVGEALLAQDRPIDANRSKLIVHAAKAGLFSGFADNHEVEVPISEGFIDEAAQQARFVIDSGRMKVLDPSLSPDKRQQVASTVRGLGAVWLSSEAPGVLPGTAVPAPDEQMCVLARDGHALAFADSHGMWLQWLP